MNKIFLYECRRLLWNKFFFGILLILLLFGWQVLDQVTILGVAHTAPFSPWSFGDYLSRMLPLLWIGALFFLTFFTSEKAQRVTVLTDAAPVPPRSFAMIRGAAALAGTGLLALACLAEAAVFYAWYFDWYAWGELLLPALATLLPSLVFALGSGWLLGQVSPKLVYVWMVLPFLCMALPLPEPLGILNGSFFTIRPSVLETLDPAFSIPVSVAAVQCLLFLAGVVLLALRPVGKGEKRFPGRESFSITQKFSGSNVSKKD